MTEHLKQIFNLLWSLIMPYEVSSKAGMQGLKDY